MRYSQPVSLATVTPSLPYSCHSIGQWTSSFFPLVNHLLNSSHPLNLLSIITPRPHHVCHNPLCPLEIHHVAPTSDFFCDDPRLGPTTLPTGLPLSSLLSPYDRLGGCSCPAEFLETFFDTSAGSFIYPPASGFQLSPQNTPIATTQKLTPGLIVDRFGPETGFFLSPASTPFSQRSLPPKNLNLDPSDPEIPSSYRVYEVEKPFNVLSGPIAPWFGQPGLGTQYQTWDPVASLVDDGFLTRVDRKCLTTRQRPWHLNSILV